MTSKQNRTVLSLLALWALTIVAAIITHWRIIRYFSVAIMIFAIGYLTISIVYAFLDTKTKSK